jgi:hypothetical protein
VILQYISTDEKNNSYFKKASVQDKVYILEGKVGTCGDFSLG